jgi:hypothetical protein
MTLKQANLILRQPLQFGNAMQIRAARFLEKVEEAMNLVKKCDQCQGNGYSTYCSDYPEVCSCIWDLPADTKEAVIENLQLYERFPGLITGDQDIDELDQLGAFE